MPASKAPPSASLCVWNAFGDYTCRKMPAGAAQADAPFVTRAAAPAGGPLPAGERAYEAFGQAGPGAPAPAPAEPHTALSRSVGPALLARKEGKEGKEGFCGCAGGPLM